jgi:uncharacterized protein (TIGR02246 family)
MRIVGRQPDVLAHHPVNRYGRQAMTYDRLRLLLIVTVSGWLIATSTVTETIGSPSESEVRSVVQRLADALNARDAIAVSLLYAPDADRIDGTTGAHAKGREAIVAMYRALLERAPLDARARFDFDVRFIRPDVALIDGTYTSTTGLRGPFTLVMTREADHWVVAAGRQGRPSQP